MSTVLEREVKKLVAKLGEQMHLDRWMTQAIFMQRTGKTIRECESFRKAHPELIRWEKADGLDVNSRTIRRNPIYDYQGFIELHKPIIK